MICSICCISIITQGLRSRLQEQEALLGQTLKRWEKNVVLPFYTNGNKIQRVLWVDNKNERILILKLRKEMGQGRGRLVWETKSQPWLPGTINKQGKRNKLFFVYYERKLNHHISFKSRTDLSSHNLPGWVGYLNYLIRWGSFDHSNWYCCNST